MDLTISVPQDSGSIGNYNIVGNKIAFNLSEECSYGFSQWFYFNVHGGHAHDKVLFTIRNAGKSLFPNGWIKYAPMYSFDGLTWLRAENYIFSKGQHLFSVNNPSKNIAIAWYQPYPLNRFTDWIGTMQSDSRVNIEHGCNNFTSLTFGEQITDSIIITARQHPGETMSSFFIEGLVTTCLAGFDNVSKSRRGVGISIFPMMNSDGVMNGYHRFGKKGIDFNRMWHSGSAPTEVDVVKEYAAHLNTVVAFFDIHGDEVTSTMKSYLVAENSNYFGVSTDKREECIYRILSDKLKDTTILKANSRFVTWLKRIVKSRKLFGTVGLPASDYFARRYGVPSYTFEISARNTNCTYCKKIGEQFGQVLLDMCEQYD